MSDYAKKTVAELQELLKSRGLPSSGKKADLVARLNENDKEATVPKQAPPAPEPEPAPTAQPVNTAAATPAQVPSTTTTEQPVEATSADPAEHPSPDTALATQTNYSLNLPTSTLDSELAKRKARAERFGTGPPQATTNETTTAPPTTEDAETLKNLERAKRFGTGQTAIGKLDEALSTELGRGSRKRAHVAEGTELNDPGLKRNFANRGRGRGGRFNGERNRSGAGKPTSAAGAARPSGVSKPAPAYTSDKDRLAAEARKKKFATA